MTLPSFGCPACGSTALARSKARNWFEVIRKQAGPKLPFRCSGCQWRGWLDMKHFPMPVAQQDPVLEVPPHHDPELDAIDETLSNPSRLKH